MAVFRRRHRNRSYTQIGKIVAIDRGEQPCYRDYGFQIAENGTTGSAEATEANTVSAVGVEADGPDGACRVVELKTFCARKSQSLKRPSTLGACGYVCDRGGTAGFRPFILGQENAASGQLAAGGKLADEAGLLSIIPRGK